MSTYAYRFYRWPTAGAFLSAWADASLPLVDGVPHIPGGALEDLGPAGEPPGNWYVMAAWPAAAPEPLISAEIPWQEGLPVYAGSQGDPPGASDLGDVDTTFEELRLW